MAVELALLREGGRTTLGIAEIEATTQRNPGIQLLPLDLDQVKEFALLSSVRDPFDRLIIAAARRVGCPLLSADDSAAASGLLRVIWE